MQCQPNIIGGRLRLLIQYLGSKRYVLECSIIDIDDNGLRLPQGGILNGSGTNNSYLRKANKPSLRYNYTWLH